MAQPQRTVTALRDRPRGRVEVELDGEPWRVVPADAVVRAGLAVGRPLDREQARDLARALRRRQALAHATRALEQRNHSRRELEERLERAGVAAVAREDALAVLEGAGLVDDGRTARSRAEALARRGYGDTGIRADLAGRGISAEVAAEAVRTLEPESERARRLIERYGAGARELRRLLARGFERETLLTLGSFADMD